MNMEREDTEMRQKQRQLFSSTLTLILVLSHLVELEICLLSMYYVMGLGNWCGYKLDTMKIYVIKELLV